MVHESHGWEGFQDCQERCECPMLSWLCFDESSFRRVGASIIPNVGLSVGRCVRF